MCIAKPLRNGRGRMRLSDEALVILAKLAGEVLRKLELVSFPPATPLSTQSSNRPPASIGPGRAHLVRGSENLMTLDFEL